MSVPVFRTFRREVTIEKMDITSAQRDVCLNILQKLAYSQNIEEYDRHRDELIHLNFESVTRYFLNSWDNLKDEWVEGLKNINMNFAQPTNNRLESLNGKLKSVCSAYSSLRQFFADLFLVLATLRNERMHKAMFMQVKRPTTSIPKELREYFEKLTFYAFNVVLKQHQLSLTIQPVVEGEFCFTTSSGNVTATLSHCLCHQFIMMGLPCKHILYVRRTSKVPLYTASICNERWSRETYVTHCGNRSDMSYPHQSIVRQQQPLQAEANVKSQHEKFRQATQVTDTLATLCSEPGMQVYKKRITFLKQLRDYWSNGTDVQLTTNGPESSNTDNATGNGSGDNVAQVLAELVTLQEESDDGVPIIQNDEVRNEINITRNQGEQAHNDDEQLLHEVILTSNRPMRSESNLIRGGYVVNGNIDKICEPILVEDHLILNEDIVGSIQQSYTDSSDEEEEQFENRIFGHNDRRSTNLCMTEAVTKVETVLLPSPLSATDTSSTASIVHPLKLTVSSTKPANVTALQKNSHFNTSKANTSAFLVPSSFATSYTCSIPNSHFNTTNANTIAVLVPSSFATSDTSSIASIVHPIKLTFPLNQPTNETAVQETAQSSMTKTVTSAVTSYTVLSTSNANSTA